MISSIYNQFQSFVKENEFDTLFHLKFIEAEFDVYAFLV